MSSYRVSLTANAEKELQGLPAKMVARIAVRVERLTGGVAEGKKRGFSADAIRAGRAGGAP